MRVAQLVMLQMVIFVLDAIQDILMIMPLKNAIVLYRDVILVKIKMEANVNQLHAIVDIPLILFQRLVFVVFKTVLFVIIQMVAYALLV